MRITEQELKSINGGRASSVLGSIIGGVGIFVIGFISGWKRPLTCKSGK